MLSCEVKAGIGGEMVVAGRRQAAKAKPRGSGSQKKKAGGGTAKLKKAAGKELDEHSDEIAVSLRKKLIGGNVPCGKLLIALAEGQAECEGEPVVSKLRSMASELASEQECDGELDEAEAEAGLGHH
jgi:hypothetical protein